MTKTRTYKGPRFGPDGEGTLEDVPLFPATEKRASCDRWGVTVLSSPAVGATEAVRQLAKMEDWCVLVVGYEKNGEGRCMCGRTIGVTRRWSGLMFLPTPLAGIRTRAYITKWAE